MPLPGKTVLITRAAEADDTLGRLLQERGATILRFPTILIVDPDSWDECDRAIINLRGYDGIFFTSRNAVTKFLGRLDAMNPAAKSILVNRPVYAVGEKTGIALEEAGIPVALTPEISSGQELAAMFSGGSAAGKKFLFPRSSIARDILPNALRSLDAVVDEVVVYQTISPSQQNLETIRRALMQGEVDIVTFFSPSAVRNYLQMMGSKSLERTLVAVIGPTTAAAAAELGLEVSVVAQHATAESLVKTLEEF